MTGIGYGKVKVITMKIRNKRTKRVVVAMSGGVDSAMAAYYLRNSGHEVSGVTLRVCENSGHIDRARAIAELLDIPLKVVDVRGQFSEKVIDFFCAEYLAGRTPNPCLRCNRFIKFGMLMDSVCANGDYFATGHYAKVSYDSRRRVFELRRGVDQRKDQSYVLYMLNQRRLRRLLLPLGEYTKDEICRQAGKLRLPVKESDESQDICFIPNGDYAGFIMNRMPQCGGVPGPVRGDGITLNATHKGAIYYTIGQRKGLGIAYTQPLFVTKIDIKKNTVFAGPEERLYAKKFDVRQVSFTHPCLRKKEFISQVKIRYHHAPAEALVRYIRPGTWRVNFRQAQKAITPGQAAVFYHQDMVIGGGIIAKVV